VTSAVIAFSAKPRYNGLAPGGAPKNNLGCDKMLTDWKKDVETLAMRLADLRVSL
jgi:hypothetical protein